MKLSAALGKWGAAALACLSLMAGAASAATADSQLDQIYQAAVGNGAYGYYLKQVGGPVVFARNDGFVYDPASALKTLYLAYAMRQVVSGADSLTNPVTEYYYPNSPNGAGDGASPNLCPDPGDENPANQVSPAPSLQTVLTQMMQVSDNRAARAVEIRPGYGRGNFNALAASLGMGSTRLNQIIGCGNTDGQSNSWTLDDAGRLYEGIMNGSVVPVSDTDQLLSFINSTTWGAFDPFVTGFVKPAADALGLDSAIASFISGLKEYSKYGAYDINGQVTRDEAGIFVVPFQTPQGLMPRYYTFGSFITGETCSCGTQAFAAVSAGDQQMLKDVIQQSLQGMAQATQLGVFGAAYTPHGLKVSANLQMLYSGKPVAGQTIKFTAKGRTLCTAVTNAQGVATCTGLRPPASAKQYNASFAGANGLLASSDFAPLPAAKVRLSVKRQAGSAKGGMVLSSPAGIACGTRCSALFNPGQSVTLTARPPKGYRVRWSGACHGTASKCRLRASQGLKPTDFEFVK